MSDLTPNPQSSPLTQPNSNQEQQQQSESPNTSRLNRSRSSSSSVLTFDPEEQVPYLNPELIIDEHLLEKEKDDEEFEAILNDFQMLSKEFLIWSSIKLNNDDEKYWNDLVRDEKVVLEEQDVQEGSREVIRGILQAVKNIFSNW